MRNLGIVLVVAGLLTTAYFGLVYSTDQTVGGSIGGASLELSVKDPEREDTRKNWFTAGLGALLGGGVMVALSSRKR